MARRARALALAGALIAASIALAATTAAAVSASPLSIGTLQSLGCTSGACFMGTATRASSSPRP